MQDIALRLILLASLSFPQSGEYKFLSFGIILVYPTFVPSLSLYEVPYAQPGSHRGHEPRIIEPLGYKVQ
jgi:hypothetical protein